VIWITGYTAAYSQLPEWLVWPVLVVIGMIGSFWIGWRTGIKDSRATLGWRYAATLLALVLFSAALLEILPPRSSAQIDAFFPVLVALCYVLLGVSTGGTRIALLGVALGALTAGGYFWQPQHFPLWMAGVGGGALILGGFWLRSA
jgi:hypothetical protein